MKNKNQKIILVSNIGSMSRKYFVYSIENKKDKKENKNKEIKELFNICFDQKEYYPNVKLSDAILEFFNIAKREYNFTLSDIDIIAERVVAPGEYFLEHKLIDERYLKELENIKKYDPLHTEDLIKEIEKINLIKEVAKKNKIKANFKLVGISDSEFNSTIKKENYIYPIKDFDKNLNKNFRKFGYHGISMSEIVNNLENKKSKVIAVHLGGGGSVTAIENGKSLWNSFGMTPVSGIVNMTRVGDIDPFVALEIFDNNKKSFSLFDEVNYQFEKTKTELYKESGMYAISGEKDMRDILNNLKSKDRLLKEKAEFAIRLYINRILEKMGSAFALLDGCDQIILTGSILEKSEIFRKRLLEKLKWLNLEKENIKVIKTEEEKEIARIVKVLFA